MRMSSQRDAIVAEYELPPRRGPRAGVHIPLDHLDRQFDAGAIVDRSQQVTPVIIESDPEYQWSYLAWHRSESDLLVTVIDGPHAGWRIVYSYPGHRMVGFRVFTQADDVIARESFASRRLPTTSKLTLRFALAESRLDAVRVAHRLLRRQLHWRRDCTIPKWRTFAETSIAFHLKHFQLDSGAIARSVHGTSLRPDRRTTSGRHFGDSMEAGSCMTGEFGGFAVWAAILNGDIGRSAEHEKGIDRYFDWLLNRKVKGEASRVYPGTIWPPGVAPPPVANIAPGPQGTTTATGGASPAAHHLWGVPHFAQYETWAIAQLADGVKYGLEELREPLVALLDHFLDAHVGRSGAVYNIRYEDTPQDYSTVDAPLVHIVHAARAIETSHPRISRSAFAAARGIADFILSRGFAFPTEGEQCTEDGSIACAAWSLAFAANELPEPDARWLPFARELLEFHRKLEMTGTDVRTDGSTIRFWETMYESDDWGPSINAGHAWTLWTAFAEWEMHRATGEYHWLKAAWKRTLCVASKARPDGGFPVCFTPDPVPQTPHADVSAADESGDDVASEGYQREGEVTTVTAGNAYTASLSASSMFLFVFASTSWYHTCGLDPDTGEAINATYHEGLLIPDTPAGCDTIALFSSPKSRLRVSGLRPGKTLSLVIDPSSADDFRSLTVSGASIQHTSDGALINPTGGTIALEP